MTLRERGKKPERREDKETNREQSVTGRARQGIVKQRQQAAMKESKREKEKYKQVDRMQTCGENEGGNIPSRDSYHHDNPLLSPLLSSCMMNSCYICGPQHGHNIHLLSQPDNQPVVN